MGLLAEIPEESRRVLVPSIEKTARMGIETSARKK
jgi:hypothetical protein